MWVNGLNLHITCSFYVFQEGLLCPDSDQVKLLEQLMAETGGLLTDVTQEAMTTLLTSLSSGNEESLDAALVGAKEDTEQTLDTGETPAPVELTPTTESQTETEADDDQTDSAQGAKGTTEEVGTAETDSA